MKKKIAIIGSTGSIGKTLLDILKKNKKEFEIKLLTANKNFTLLLKQAKIFKVKYLIITDNKSYEKLKKKPIRQILKFLITLHHLIRFLIEKLIM